jgi:hypothetical protein
MIDVQVRIKISRTMHEENHNDISQMHVKRIANLIRRHVQIYNFVIFIDELVLFRYNFVGMLPMR